MTFCDRALDGCLGFLLGALGGFLGFTSGVLVCSSVSPGFLCFSKELSGLACFPFGCPRGALEAPLASLWRALGVIWACLGVRLASPGKGLECSAFFLGGLRVVLRFASLACG